MITVEVNCPVKAPWSKPRIIKAVEIASKFEKKIKGSVEINFIGETLMRKMNRECRGKDRVTDVLSFAWQEDHSFITDCIGQIYICPKQIKRQAKEFKISESEELARMLAHGLLHLTGYDHGSDKEATAMFLLQEKIVDAVVKS